MKFLLAALNVVYVLSTPKPAEEENETLEAARRRMKWENDDLACRGHILNGMSDTLFDIYQYEESSKDLWDVLEAKYISKDASSKKFLVSEFNEFKMVDNRPVMKQFHEIVRILGQIRQHGMNMDDSIAIANIIDKLPPSWKKKENKTRMSAKVTGASSSSINYVDEGKASQNRKGKGKLGKVTKSFKFKKNGKGKGKASVVCWVCNGPHFKRDCEIWKKRVAQLEGKISGDIGQGSGQLKQGKIINLVSDSTTMFIVMISEICVMQTDDSWWVDTRATRHICKDINLYKIYKSLDDGPSLYMGNDSMMKIGDSIDEDEDSVKDDSNDQNSDEEDSNVEKSDEENSNGDKSDEEDTNDDKSNEEDSNGEKSDDEDSNGDKSDEEDCNGNKSDEEDSNGDKSDEEEWGDPIIVSLDRHGRIVHHNAMYMMLMRAGDLSQGIDTGVEIGDSIIPSLQNMLKERTLAVRSVMPDIDRKLDQIVGSMERVMIEGLAEIGKQIQNLAVLLNQRPARIKFLDETHGDEESDEIATGLKLLLAYEGNGLAVGRWAMLCKGNEIVVCDLGEKMLTVVNEYEKWQESAIAKGFDKAFKDVHHMLGSTSQHHPCCTLEYPSNFDKIPKNVKCPQCCHNMQKLIAF
nr:zinc finger, CCHC-type [Ipomoea batatas]